MKTTIILIMGISFFSGCGGGENPEITRIQTEWDITLQEMNELVPIAEDWSERHTQFMGGLTDDKLEVYAAACKPGTEAEGILQLRRLQDILSEDEWRTLVTLTEEKASWGPKAQNLIDRRQSLERQWESARQNALYESQQRRARSQIMLQQYYQQQQLQQSLIGIENAIRNQ